MSDHLDSYEGPTGDTALVRFLYPAPAERRTGAIIKWWEKRRLPYNLIVGASGLTTLTVASLLSSGGPGPGGFLAPVVFVGLMANIAYSLGSIVELTVNKLWGRKVLPIGPALFRQGVLFSVGLTLVVPLIFMTVTTIIRILVGGF